GRRRFDGASTPSPSTPSPSTPSPSTPVPVDAVPAPRPARRRSGRATHFLPALGNAGAADRLPRAAAGRTIVANKGGRGRGGRPRRRRAAGGNGNGPTNGNGAAMLSSSSVLGVRRAAAWTSRTRPKYVTREQGCRDHVGLSTERRGAGRGARRPRQGWPIRGK